MTPPGSEAPVINFPIVCKGRFSMPSRNLWGTAFLFSGILSIMIFLSIGDIYRIPSENRTIITLSCEPSIIKYCYFPSDIRYEAWIYRKLDFFKDIITLTFSYKANYIKEMYFLEISSPGIERTLRKENHFQENIGNKIDIKLFKPIEGKKEYQGLLKSFDKEKIEVEEQEGKIIELDRKNISLVKLHYDWD